MSYCRWSSDDFQCDVYVYEHVHGGFVTHVAGNRRTPSEPFPPQVSITDIDAYIARRKIVDAMLEATERKPIGLPHDGESFNDDTASECADRLERLRALGYNVPQRAIDALREEAAA